MKRSHEDAFASTAICFVNFNELLVGPGEEACLSDATVPPPTRPMRQERHPASGFCVRKTQRNLTFLPANGTLISTAICTYALKRQTNLTWVSSFAQIASVIPMGAIGVHYGIVYRAAWIADIALDPLAKALPHGSFECALTLGDLALVRYQAKHSCPRRRSAFLCADFNSNIEALHSSPTSLRCSQGRSVKDATLRARLFNMAATRSDG